MNHQPFEDWLLNGKSLEPEEDRQLRIHLRDCKACSTLAEVTSALESPRMSSPVNGFIDRFQVRLQARKRALRRRNFLGFLLLTLVVVAFFLWISLLVVRPVFMSPADFLTEWVSRLLVLWTSFQAVESIFRMVMGLVPGFVKVGVWLLIILGAAGWTLVWFVSMKKFAGLPQGVKS